MDFTPSSDTNLNSSANGHQYFVATKKKPVDEYGLPYQTGFEQRQASEASYLANPFNFLHSPEIFDKQLNTLNDWKQSNTSLAAKNFAISRANQQYFSYFPTSLYGAGSMATAQVSSGYPTMHPINFPVFTAGNPYAISPAIVSNHDVPLQSPRTPTLLQLPISSGQSSGQHKSLQKSSESEEDIAVKKRKVSTCSSVSCSSPVTSKDKRQNRKDFIDALQLELLDTLEQDENLVRKAKLLEAEIARLKANLNCLGLNDQEIGKFVISHHSKTVSASDSETKRA